MGRIIFLTFCDLNKTFIFMSQFSMKACPQMKYELVVQRKEGHICLRASQLSNLCTLQYNCTIHNNAV